MAATGTATAALDWMRANLGLGEDPPGSNHNFITSWFGVGDAPWCAMTVSLALNEAFGERDRWQVPGVGSDFRHGTAYVPNLRIHFIEAGRFDKEPRVGDVVIFGWTFGSDGDHTGLVEQVVGDGTVVTLEGNHNDQLVRMRRSMNVILGFGHPAYDAEPDPGADKGRPELPEMVTYDIATPDGNGQTFLLRSQGPPVFLAKASDVRELRERAGVPHAGELSRDLHLALMG